MSVLYETSAEAERRGTRPLGRALDTAPPDARAAELLQLQRTAGNAAVSSLMRDPVADVAAAVATAADIASFQLTILRHLANRATIERWIEEGLASADAGDRTRVRVAEVATGAVVCDAVMPAVALPVLAVADDGSAVVAFGELPDTVRTFAVADGQVEPLAVIDLTA